MTGRAKRVAQGLSVAAVAVLLGVLVWKVTHESAGAAGELSGGKVVPAPALVLPRLDGSGMLALSSLKGKAVVVNFWASWCIPCREEAPLLERAWQQHRAGGLVVLGVDAQDFTGDARAFVRRHGLTYPIVRDAHGSTLGHWGVTGFPITFFVDRRGMLVEKIVGGIAVGDNEKTFQRGVERVLGRS